VHDARGLQLGTERRKDRSLLIQAAESAVSCALRMLALLFELAPELRI